MNCFFIEFRKINKYSSHHISIINERILVTSRKIILHGYHGNGTPFTWIHSFQRWNEKIEEKLTFPNAQHYEPSRKRTMLQSIALCLPKQVLGVRRNVIHRHSYPRRPNFSFSHFPRREINDKEKENRFRSTLLHVCRKKCNFPTLLLFSLSRKGKTLLFSFPFIPRTYL